MFNFQLSGQAPAGTGGSLLFAIQPVNDSQSGSGNAGTLGILDLVKTLGIGFKFNAQNNASMVVMFSSDLNIPTSSYPTNLAPSDTNIHCFYLSYSVLTSPPILVGYMDLNYVFSYQLNLTSLFGTSQIYPGLM